MNHAQVIEGFDMSIKLDKPRIKERCIQILTLRKFKDLLDQSQERNRMNEDSFIDLIRLHNEMKNKSHDPSEFLKLTDVEHVIKDYCQQRFKDIKLQDEKRAQYLKLIAESEIDSENDNVNLLKTLLNIDKQIQKLIFDNKVQSTQIIEQNEELKGSLNKVLDENSFLKSKLDGLKDDFGVFKAQSSQLIEAVRKENEQFVTKVDFLSFKNAQHRNEIEIFKTESNEIIEQNIRLKEDLDKLLLENSQIKADSNSILLKNAELNSALINIKDESIQLLQKNNLLQEKLDKVSNENEQLEVNSDYIISQLANKTTETVEKESQTLSQEILPLKPKLNQLPVQINPIISHSLLLDKIKKARMDKNYPSLHTNTINKIISYDNNTKYITSSGDMTIIIRNSEDNSVIRTFTNHTQSVRYLLLLSDGRLASSSQDKTIKIWNLTNGCCEQTLIGHSSCVFNLLELPNSILLSGSKDSSLGIFHKEIRTSYNFIIK